MVAESKRYTLSELADKSATSPRTLRYYIARGLLDGPDKAGRDAGYCDDHLSRIAEIKRLQERGMTLAEIVHELIADNTDAAQVPVTGPAASWRHYTVADDVVLMIRDDAAPWRVRTIVKSMGQLSQILAGQQSGKEK